MNEMELSRGEIRAGLLGIVGFLRLGALVAKQSPTP